MPRRSLLQLLQAGVPCPKPGMVRHPRSGRCGRPLVHQQPSYMLSDLRRRLAGPKPRPLSMAAQAGCLPGQRYVMKAGIRRCITPVASGRPRKVRKASSKCKYGLDAAGLRCLKARAAAKKAAKELKGKKKAVKKAVKKVKEEKKEVKKAEKKVKAKKVQVKAAEQAAKKRGRPKGSKNKPKK